MTPVEALMWFVLLAAVIVVAGGLLIAHRARRLHHDAQALRWTSGPPTPSHQVLEGMVGQAAALGYVVHGHAVVRLVGMDVAVTLLAHPDGSIVDATALPQWFGRHQILASVTSLLADRRSTLETGPTQGTLAGPHQLAEVLPGADLAALVAQHGATRAWLAWRGFPAVAHERGPAGLYEHSAHLVGSQQVPPAWEVWRIGTGRSIPNRGPLAEQPGIEHRLAALGSVGHRPLPPRG